MYIFVRFCQLKYFNDAYFTKGNFVSINLMYISNRFCQLKYVNDVYFTKHDFVSKYYVYFW